MSDDLRALAMDLASWANEQRYHQGFSERMARQAESVLRAAVEAERPPRGAPMSDDMPLLPAEINDAIQKGTPTSYEAARLMSLFYKTLRASVEAEREAIAKFVESWHDFDLKRERTVDPSIYWRDRQMAEDIRARKL
jgi:hypothetical protein